MVQRFSLLSSISPSRLCFLSFCWRNKLFGYTCSCPWLRSLLVGLLSLLSPWLLVLLLVVVVVVVLLLLKRRLSFFRCCTAFAFSFACLRVIGVAAAGMLPLLLLLLRGGLVRQDRWCRVLLRRWWWETETECLLSLSGCIIESKRSNDQLVRQVVDVTGGHSTNSIAHCIPQTVLYSRKHRIVWKNQASIALANHVILRRITTSSGGDDAKVVVEVRKRKCFASRSRRRNQNGAPVFKKLSYYGRTSTSAKWLVLAIRAIADCLVPIWFGPV